MNIQRDIIRPTFLILKGAVVSDDETTNSIRRLGLPFFRNCERIYKGYSRGEIVLSGVSIGSIVTLCSALVVSAIGYGLYLYFNHSAFLKNKVLIDALDNDDLDLKETALSSVKEDELNDVGRQLYLRLKQDVDHSCQISNMRKISPLEQSIKQALDSENDIEKLEEMIPEDQIKLSESQERMVSLLLGKVDRLKTQKELEKLQQSLNDLLTVNKLNEMLLGAEQNKVVSSDEITQAISKYKIASQHIDIGKKNKDVLSEKLEKINLVHEAISAVYQAVESKSHPVICAESLAAYDKVVSEKLWYEPDETKKALMQDIQEYEICYTESREACLKTFEENIEEAKDIQAIQNNITDFLEKIKIEFKTPFKWSEQKLDELVIDDDKVTTTYGITQNEKSTIIKQLGIENKLKEANKLAESELLKEIKSNQASFDAVYECYLEYLKGAKKLLWIDEDEMQKNQPLGHYINHSLVDRDILFKTLEKCIILLKGLTNNPKFESMYLRKLQKLNDDYDIYKTNCPNGLKINDKRMGWVKNRINSVNSSHHPKKRGEK